MAKFLKILKILIKARYTIRKIHQKDLLLYDSLTLEIAKDKLSYSLLETRKESFNLRVLIKNMLKFKFSFKSYLESSIKEANPKLVITLNDNDPLFYGLKKKFPKIKFAAIQNGWRHLNDESFEKKSFSIDYLFIFGKNSVSYYKKYINCKNYIILGSFRNNNHKILNQKKKGDILFISNFRENFLTKFDVEFKVEPDIIKILNAFCQFNKIKFYIAGSSLDNYDKEKKYFFSKLPKKNNGIMIKRQKDKSYKLIDQFNTIMFIDSSLGYEAIGRKKKIISISSRKKNKKIYHPFGYPSFLSKNSSYFFTNFNNKKKILQIIKNVYSMSNLEWNKKYYNKLNKLMVYNFNNTKLYSKINQILEQ